MNVKGARLAIGSLCAIAVTDVANWAIRLASLGSYDPLTIAVLVISLFFVVGIGFAVAVIVALGYRPAPYVASAYALWHVILLVYGIDLLGILATLAAALLVAAVLHPRYRSYAAKRRQMRLQVRDAETSGSVAE